MANRKPIRRPLQVRIFQNRYGNVYAYAGKRRIKCFGVDWNRTKIKQWRNEIVQPRHPEAIVFELPATPNGKTTIY